MSTLATIDIGSNTLLLLIVEPRDGRFVTLVSECEYGRLGQGLADGKNRLHPEAIERSLAIVKDYRQILQAHQVDAIAVVATQALREAENRDAFIVPAEYLLGCKIELISGEREAKLVAQAVLQNFPELCKSAAVIVDVGGASTEFIFVEQGRIIWVKSIAIGAVRMHERYLHSEVPTQEETETLFAAIDAAIAEVSLPDSVTVVGTAGTATTLASMHLRLPDYNPEAIDGLSLAPEEVASCLNMLLKRNSEEKKALPGLPAKRADVIAAGVAIYWRVLEKCAATRLVVCDKGIRWGLCYELANQ